jgi:hypothetical protein
MRRDHLDAVLWQLCIQRIAVIGAIAEPNSELQSRIVPYGSGRRGRVW